MFKNVLLLLLFTSILASAETIYLKASASKKTVPLNEYFIYSVIMTGDSTNLPEYNMDAVPEFNRFGMAVSQSISVVNGRTSMSITRDYALGPKKIGKFTIPSAKITFKGKTYLTENVEIEVTPSQNVKSTPFGADQRQQEKFCQSFPQIRRLLMKTRRWFINLALNECCFHIKSRMLAIDFFMFSE